MKVLLINGSPHEKGCTYTALSLIAKELNDAGVDTEILHVGGKPVGGCIGCGGCARSGKRRCVFGAVILILFWTVEKNLPEEQKAIKERSKK